MQEKTANQMIASGSLLTIFILLWPIFMFLSPATGSIDEQLRHIALDPVMFKLGFMLASLIAPTFYYLILTLIRYEKPNLDVFDIVGIIFVTLYLLLVSISYISQYTLVLHFIGRNNMAMAKNWYFASPGSVSYFLNQMGYASWGIGIMFIFRNYIWGRGLKRILGVVLLSSACLSIVAFVGLLMQNKVINFLTLPAGLLTIPVGIIVLLLGVQIKKVV